MIVSLRRERPGKSGQLGVTQLVKFARRHNRFAQQDRLQDAHAGPLRASRVAHVWRDRYDDVGFAIPRGCPGAKCGRVAPGLRRPARRAYQDVLEPLWPRPARAPRKAWSPCCGKRAIRAPAGRSMLVALAAADRPLTKWGVRCSNARE